MLEKFRRFMYGRNGWDVFCFALTVFSLVLSIVLRLFFARGQLWWISRLSYLPLIYALYRALSKNTYARQRENQWFLRVWYKIKDRFTQGANTVRERKEYKIFTCPECGQKLRIPRSRGKVAIRCPKCSKRFIGKT